MITQARFPKRSMAGGAAFVGDGRSGCLVIGAESVGDACTGTAQQRKRLEVLADEGVL